MTELVTVRGDGTRVVRKVSRVVRVADLEKRGTVDDVVVTLGVDGIVLRRKGKRTKYVLPFVSAWWRAADLEAQRIVREKKAARVARKTAKTRGAK